MSIMRVIAQLVLLSLLGAQAHAGTPTVGAPLPALSIDDRGELVMNADDFSFVPWTAAPSGQVEVIQYFGANLGDRDVFEPFTNMLEAETEPGSVQVTTVLNMDAAMWGTSGMVLSELKKSKKKYPESTMVLDEDGDGVDAWGLGKEGTGLIILDAEGKVLFFKVGALADDQLAAAIALIKDNIAGE